MRVSTALKLLSTTQASVPALLKVTAAGLAMRAAAPVPGAKPGAPPTPASVVTARLARSTARTVLAPASAMRARLPASLMAAPAGVTNEAAEPTPSA